MESLTLDQVYCGDCYDLLECVEPRSIDLVLTDPPYGVTVCDWDTKLDLARFWAAILPLLRHDAGVVMTATQPFTSELVVSNRAMFKYCWVWNKKAPGNIYTAKYAPLRTHEDIVVFAQGRNRYFPIMEAQDKTR